MSKASVARPTPKTPAPGTRMNAKKAARKPSSPSDTDATLALLQAPGFLDINRARAAMWLLEQIDGEHLSFSPDHVVGTG